LAEKTAIQGHNDNNFVVDVHKREHQRVQTPDSDDLFILF
tara:strand:+ start:1013 stop:1132 length:120 start_codon:yes stop_codon:yes gene_type:complete